MSVYKYGSQSYVYDNDNLCVPSLEWIGLKLDDLEIFQVRNESNFLMKLTQHDTKIAKGLITKFKLLNEYDLVKQVIFLFKFKFGNFKFKLNIFFLYFKSSSS